MKILAVLLAGCAAASIVSIATSQVAPVAAPQAGGSNHLVIIATNDARMSPTNAIWRGGVRAAEEGFYLECEVLTAIFKTNAARADIAGADTGPSVTNTNIETKFDLVIAETNVMIITKDSQIIGDRAVYYGSNDFLHVTGDLVIAITAQGSIVCTNITFDRASGSSWVAGTSTLLGTQAIVSRTNAPAGRTNATSTPVPRKK